jgi:LysR family transcriptional regulator, transcriptional activator for dmlA
LQLLQQGQHALAQQKEEPSGTIRIACPVLMARDVLPPLIAQFANEHPRLMVDISTFTPGVDALHGDSTDVVFHAWPLPKSKGHTHAFPSSRRGLYMSRGYARSAGIPDSPEDLKRFDFIGSQGHPYFGNWRLKGTCCEVIPELNFKFTACDPETLRKLMLEDLGISVIPVWMALEAGTCDRLIRVLPEWEPTPFSLLATCPKGEPLVPKVSIFLDFLRGYLGTSLDPRARGKSVSDCFVDQ